MQLNLPWKKSDYPKASVLQRPHADAPETVPAELCLLGVPVKAPDVQMKPTWNLQMSPSTSWVPLESPLSTPHGLEESSSWALPEFLTYKTVRRRKIIFG